MTALQPRKFRLWVVFAIAVAMLTALVSAVKAHQPQIFARQQQQQLPPGAESSTAALGSGGGGGNSGSSGGSTSLHSTSSPQPAQQPPAILPGPSATPPASSLDPSSLKQTGSSGSTVVGLGGTAIPPKISGGNSSLPPIGSGGTVIGGGSGIIGPNSVIDPRRPVSRLSMIQPKQNTANPALFPVGSNIIFEWLFDNQTLVFAPTNLTIEVSMTANPKMTWPIANVTGSATSVVWNTGAVVNPSLFMGFYTLHIYDTKIGKQGVAISGHLMPYSDLQFGLYIPEPYISRAGDMQLRIKFQAIEKPRSLVKDCGDMFGGVMVPCGIIQGFIEWS